MILLYSVIFQVILFLFAVNCSNYEVKENNNSFWETELQSRKEDSQTLHVIKKEVLFILNLLEDTGRTLQSYSELIGHKQKGDIAPLERHLGKYIQEALHARDSLSFIKRWHIDSASDDLLCELSLTQLDDGIRYLNTLISQQIRREKNLQSMQYIRDLLETKRIDFMQVARTKEALKHGY